MKSNYCANCGEELGGEANFCPACGQDSEISHKFEGEVLNRKHREHAPQKDLGLPYQVVIYVISGIFGVYLFFVCTLLLIAIFKFNFIAGLLMFVIGFLGVGVLYSPLWLLGMGSFGLVALTGTTKNPVGRFFLPLLGAPVVMGLSYLWLLLVTVLVDVIIS